MPRPRLRCNGRPHMSVYIVESVRQSICCCNAGGGQKENVASEKAEKERKIQKNIDVNQKPNFISAVSLL